MIKLTCFNVYFHLSGAHSPHCGCSSSDLHNIFYVSSFCGGCIIGAQKVPGAVLTLEHREGNVWMQKCGCKKRMVSKMHQDVHLCLPARGVEKCMLNDRGKA